MSVPISHMTLLDRGFDYRKVTGRHTYSLAIYDIDMIPGEEMWITVYPGNGYDERYWSLSLHRSPGGPYTDGTSHVCVRDGLTTMDEIERFLSCFVPQGTHS